MRYSHKHRHYHTHCHYHLHVLQLFSVLTNSDLLETTSVEGYNQVLEYQSTTRMSGDTIVAPETLHNKHDIRTDHDLTVCPMNNNNLPPSFIHPVDHPDKVFIAI